MSKKFVSDEFKVPSELKNKLFHIYPLRPGHCSLDYKAVMSSIQLLKGSFIYYPSWPEESMTFEKDLSDLKYHEKEFNNRTSFTYTVLNVEENKCLGCIYIYPSKSTNFDADVFMWVTQDAFDIGLYQILFDLVCNWIKNEWPFRKVNYVYNDKFRADVMSKAAFDIKT